MLEECRNETPYGSVACTHCQRESRLAYMRAWRSQTADPRMYVAVVLVFNTEALPFRPLGNATRVKTQISRIKQRISRTLKRLTCSGPAIGTFSMVCHKFPAGECDEYWIPQLCLLLPDEEDLLKGLQNHMERGGGQYINSSVSIPLRSNSGIRTLQNVRIGF